MTETVDALDQAKELAIACPSENTRSERVEHRKHKLAEVIKYLSHPLPIEGSEAQSTFERHAELLEFTIKNPDFEERYRYLSMEVLGWRNEQGLPKLIPFTLNESQFFINIECYINYKEIQTQKTTDLSKKYPLVIAKMYNDIIEKLINEAKKTASMIENPFYHWDRKIFCEFNGIIPHWVREKIQQATS